MQLASFIDHTLLKPTSTLVEVEQVCREAIQHSFATVCVPPCFVKDAADFLSGSSISTCTVIGFPFGYSTTKIKLSETLEALADGAREIDAVLAIGRFKAGDRQYVQAEIASLSQAVHHEDAVLKLIIETAYLDTDEIRHLAEMAAEASVDFVKTSTGYAPTGATREAVQLLHQILPSSVQIKASGGIKTYQQAIQFLSAGASRLGTSSGLAILREAPTSTIDFQLPRHASV